MKDSFEQAVAALGNNDYGWLRRHHTDEHSGDRLHRGAALGRADRLLGVHGGVDEPHKLDV